MFGLIRTVVLLLVAFVAGLLYERFDASERCAAMGGTYRDAVCRGAS